MSVMQIYLGGVAVAGTLALAAAMHLLYRSTQRRRVRFARRSTLSTIEGDVPLDEESVARQRGLAAIHKQFTVTRRLLIPLIAFVVLTLMSIPFLSHVPATLVSFVAASVTIILGVAARPVVENAIAGLVLSFSRAISLGDTVEVHQHYGTVEDISVTHTTIKVWDWRRFVVPNSKMLSTEVINLTLFDRYVWAHVDFWVSYDADLTLVEQACLAFAAASAHRSKGSTSEFWIMETSAIGIRCRLAVWGDTPADAWTIRHELRGKIAALVKEKRYAPHTVPATVAPAT